MSVAVGCESIMLRRGGRAGTDLHGRRPAFLQPPRWVIEEDPNSVQQVSAEYTDFRIDRAKRPRNRGSWNQPWKCSTLPWNGRTECDALLLARFARDRDEDAFALVARHGPLVWRACRRGLGDLHAAEDAFQATLLILARKAGSVGRPDALAGGPGGRGQRAGSVTGQPTTSTAPHAHPSPLAPSGADSFRWPPCSGRAAGSPRLAAVRDRPSTRRPR